MLLLRASFGLWARVAGVFCHLEPCLQFALCLGFSHPFDTHLVILIVFFNADKFATGIYACVSYGKRTRKPIEDDVSFFAIVSDYLFEEWVWLFSWMHAFDFVSHILLQ